MEAKVDEHSVAVQEVWVEWDGRGEEHSIVLNPKTPPAGGTIWA